MARVLSRSGVEQADNREGCFAMAHDFLNLEPDWLTISVGQRVDFLAEVIIWDPDHQRTLVRSAIGRKFVLVVGNLPKATAYSFLGGLVLDTSKGFRLQVDDHCKFLPHDGCDIPDLWQVSEICSGIGAMSDGITSAGGDIKAKNELREPLIEIQRLQGFNALAKGDIGDTTVLAEFFGIHPHSTMLVAGFSCQPWSKLGDHKQLGDPRSMSLVYALRTAYFCRSHSVMLECVSEAGTDPQVLAMIDHWCRVTGFRRSSIDLKLEDFWASRRHRWWCLLLNPAAPSIDLRPLPKHSEPPTVADLLPIMPCWPPVEENELSLDLYETNKFIEFGSFETSIIKSNQPLATALHGWGNQLQGCPRGCRKSSMDHSRLQRKGLFGALIIMGGELECVAGPRLRSRHIHPWELSVLTGCPPNKTWPSSLRLALCGLGQMASPIQSCWIYAQYKFAMGKHLGLLDIPTPEEALWAHVKTVFTEYHEAFPTLYQDPGVSKFVARTHELLFDAHMNRVIPTGVAVPSISDLTPEQIVVPSQSDASEPEPAVELGPSRPLQPSPQTGDLNMGIVEDGYAWGVSEEIFGVEDHELFSLFQNLPECDIPRISEQGLSNEKGFSSSSTSAPPIPSPFTGTGGIVAFSRPSAQVQSYLTEKAVPTKVPPPHNSSLEGTDASVVQLKHDQNPASAGSELSAMDPTGLEVTFDAFEARPQVELPIARNQMDPRITGLICQPFCYPKPNTLTP